MRITTCILVTIAALILLSSPAHAEITICGWTVPSCDYPTCCNGSYYVNLSNDDSSTVDVIVRVTEYNCIDIGEYGCNYIPEGPDSVTCVEASVPGYTSCPGYSVLIYSSKTLPCSCSGPFSGRGWHLFTAEVYTGCSGYTPPPWPATCPDIEDYCDEEYVWGCQLQTNALCYPPADCCC